MQECRGIFAVAVARSIAPLLPVLFLLPSAAASDRPCSPYSLSVPRPPAAAATATATAATLGITRSISGSGAGVLEVA